MFTQGLSLRLNSTGSGVARLQDVLAVAGFAVPADERARATFGIGTQQAVMQFQKQNGIEATGVADAATLKDR